MRITDALNSIQQLGIETAPYIYFVEDHPIYTDKMAAIFQLVELKKIQINTSVITLTETLMKPIQANDFKLIDAYRRLLGQTKYVSLISVTSEIAEKAADLRARHQLRTPDALHLATAIASGCDAFLTNDKGFKRIKELTILLLDELELEPAE